MKESGWHQWSEIKDGQTIFHFELVLTEVELRRLGPYTVRQLRDAGLSIIAALAEPD